MSIFIGLVLSGVVALTYLQFLRTLVHRGFLSSNISRKLLHIGIGPLYMICWNFYPQLHPLSRYVASIIPLSITIVFIAIGKGTVQDKDLVQTMSRSGNKEELLQGPTIYGVMHVLQTLLFWNLHPAGVIALSCLCGGDGVAELTGKYFTNKNKKSKKLFIPWSHGNKTWAGSIGFICCAFVMALVVLPFSGAIGFDLFSIFDILKLLFVVLIASIVETLPFHDIDNATVTLTAAFISWLLW